MQASLHFCSWPRQVSFRVLAAAAWVSATALNGFPADVESESMAGASVVLETSHFRYVIGADGRNLSFIDRATGRDYLSHEPRSVCAWVRQNGTEILASSVSLRDGRLAVRFGDTPLKAVLSVECLETYLRLTVVSLTGGLVDSLVFVNIPLTLNGRPEEGFGACAFSLNLQTRVDALPALQTHLRASCYEKFGLEKAQVALVGVPMEGMLSALRQVLSEADQMPHCTVAGPWAGDIPFNHGSYLFNFGALTESNLEEWIQMAKRLGVTQIDHHGGSGFFRFGDFELNRAKWPEGWETYRRLVQRLHEAGIGSIFHTYAFFIDKQSKYVSPVPDRRLDAFRVFTLEEGISPEATEIRVRESTKGLTAVTGFFEHNSVVLHLGDELVAFRDVRQEPPWGFTGITRGAFGTRPAAHAKDTQARHLKECFGLFVPDVESSLFEEIARRHADIVNACGFDGMYLDAIDGSSILRGPEECWYWADKFVFAIQGHLKRPVGMEMSAMWHHFWQFRTRFQAWDYPTRGHKRFLDIHAAAVHGSLLLPLHLGWWNFQSFNPPQIEPTYPDVIEYLGAKLVGWDAGISLTGSISQEQLAAVPLFGRAVDILRTCEELRRSGGVNETVRAQLREPGKEFSLVRDNAGSWGFRPTHYDSHRASLAEPWSLVWNVDNPFSNQPIQLRLEVLMSAGPYDHPGNIALIDPADPKALGLLVRTAKGVEGAFRASPEKDPRQAQDGLNPNATALFTALHSGVGPRNGAWARVDRKLEPWLNLKNHQALGLWVEGDGGGELLAVRLESPRHLAYGAVADRYVTVDFTGPRLVTLVETESARWSDYTWNDGKWHYNVYRETIDFGAVESVSLWLQNLPPTQEARCRVGAIKAMPMVPATLKNPTVTVNGQALVFPVEMETGCFLEFDGGKEGVVYGAKGELRGNVAPDGVVPTLQAGPNQIEFSCEPMGEASTRARVVVMAHGPPLAPAVLD